VNEEASLALLDYQYNNIHRKGFKYFYYFNEKKVERRCIVSMCLIWPENELLLKEMVPRSVGN
jgi:hypothetical protein